MLRYQREHSAWCDSDLAFPRGGGGGYAQTSPLTKVETRVRAGWKARLSIVLTPSVHVVERAGEALISGTNVNFTVGAEFPPLTIPPDLPGGPWAHTSIEWIELTIGGEPSPPVRWEPGEVPLPGGPPGVSHAIRFASTHFADGPAVDIVLQGRFRVWNDATPPLEDSVQFTATLPARVYNKAIALATVEQWIPNDPEHWSKPGDSDYPNPAPVAATAALAVAAVIPFLIGPAMRHTLIPSATFDGKSWRESDDPNRLDDKMCDATFFYACTHGTDATFRASHTDELTYTGLGDSDVRRYVTTRPGTPRLPRDVPAYSMAIFHSCETLGPVSSNFCPKAFRVLPDEYPNPYVPFPNQAYAGFGGVCHYQLYFPSGENLEKHAERLLYRLSQGDYLELALLRTQNSLYTPTPKKPKDAVHQQHMAMIIRGDPYARIVNVYLSKSEWDSVSDSVRNSWYWVIS